MALEFDPTSDELVLHLDEGDTEVIEIERVDDDGNAIDISGWEFWLTIKLNEDIADNDAELQEHVTNHKDAANGLTEIEVSAGDIDFSGTYRYDIQEEQVNNVINTLAKGPAEISPQITEAP